MCTAALSKLLQYKCNFKTKCLFSKPENAHVVFTTLTIDTTSKKKHFFILHSMNLKCIKQFFCRKVLWLELLCKRAKWRFLDVIVAIGGPATTPLIGQTLWLLGQWNVPSDRMVRIDAWLVTGDLKPSVLWHIMKDDVMLAADERMQWIGWDEGRRLDDWLMATCKAKKILSFMSICTTIWLRKTYMENWQYALCLGLWVKWEYNNNGTVPSWIKECKRHQCFQQVGYGWWKRAENNYI